MAGLSLSASNYLVDDLMLAVHAFEAVGRAFRVETGRIQARTGKVLLAAPGEAFPFDWSTEGLLIGGILRGGVKRPVC